ncbi:j domain-containing protein 1 [[Candida] railenensis]|uniref:J domain-containing protein 1 n=1 Tax=[Candida] railenensis TaxID=45579 RepID=A0A9P0QLQ7_9ASCO|nr:j domain-containing protein 1 [[Candida] railenensis]
MLALHKQPAAVLLGLRAYSSSADLPNRKKSTTDPHIRLGLPPWPDSVNPSPKEIFGFDTMNIPDFDVFIKRKYQTYVKVYHPDVSSKYEITHRNDEVLTVESKRQRYDQITSAYNILRDPQRRHAYWRFENSTTNYSQRPRPQASQSEASFQRFRQASARRTAYSYQNDEAFWQAATWEDYYKMKYKREPPTAEEIEKNKYKILAGVLAVGFISAILQYLYALKRTDDFHAEQALMNLRASDNLEGSKKNYDYGTGSQGDRLKRFLLSRRFNFMDKGDIETSTRMKEEEEKIMMKHT